MISANEHASGVRAMFDRMDANRDGNVTTAEMGASHKMKGDKGIITTCRWPKDRQDGYEWRRHVVLVGAHAGARTKFTEMDSDKKQLSMELDAGHAMMEGV